MRSVFRFHRRLVPAFRVWSCANIAGPLDKTGDDSSIGGRKLCCKKLAVTCALLASAGIGTPRAAEPLVTQGIGASSCAKLAGDLNPAEGLSNPVNIMLYAWVQGYVSAANVALLERSAKHVDIAALDDATVLKEVFAFCKANPDKKPITAVDAMIWNAEKIRAKWEPGTIAWDE